RSEEEFVRQLCDEGLVLFFSSRRRHTRFSRDWSSDVCSSDLYPIHCVLRGDDKHYIPADHRRQRQPGQGLPGTWRRGQQHAIEVVGHRGLVVHLQELALVRHQGQPNLFQFGKVTRAFNLLIVNIGQPRFLFEDVGNLPITPFGVHAARSWCRQGFENIQDINGKELRKHQLVTCHQIEHKVHDFAGLPVATNVPTDLPCINSFNYDVGRGFIHLNDPQDPRDGSKHYLTPNKDG